MLWLVRKKAISVEYEIHQWLASHHPLLLNQITASRNVPLGGLRPREVSRLREIVTFTLLCLLIRQNNSGLREIVTPCALPAWISRRVVRASHYCDPDSILGSNVLISISLRICVVKLVNSELETVMVIQCVLTALIKHFYISSLDERKCKE